MIIMTSIRMFILQRRANYLIRYARRGVHIQSDHMIGYKVVRDPDYTMSPIWWLAFILMMIVVVCVNFYYPEPDISVSCSIAGK